MRYHLRTVHFNVHILNLPFSISQSKSCKWFIVIKVFAVIDLRVDVNVSDLKDLYSGILAESTVKEHKIDKVRYNVRIFNKIGFPISKLNE